MRNRSPGRDAGRARAAAAEPAPAERDLASKLIVAARTAARQWGNATPATETLIAAAASIGARRETPAAQRAVLKRIDWETAPLGRPLDRGCRIETPLPSREAGGGRPAPSAGPRRVERPAAAAAAVDDRQAGTRESRPAEPAGRRGRPCRAVRRRPGGNGRRARAGHAEAGAARGARPHPAGRDHAAPRCALAAFGGTAPERWRGRAPRRGEAPGSSSDPRHVVRAGAGNVAGAAGPRDRGQEPSF